MTSRCRSRRGEIAIWLLPVLFLAVALNAQELAAEDSCPPPTQCWTTQDVIDEHISHYAQSVLMGMLTRGGDELVDASSMLCAVKRRALEGIYIAETAAPIARATSVGSYWWEMIPKGKNSACYRRPPEQPPMIVFRRQVQDLRPQLEAALREAWQDCGTISVARCYTKTISRPSDPSMNDGVWVHVDWVEDSECLAVWSCQPTAVFSGDSSLSQTGSRVVLEKTEDKITEGLCIPDILDGGCTCAATAEPEEPCKFRWGDSQVPATTDH